MRGNQHFLYTTLLNGIIFGCLFSASIAMWGPIHSFSQSTGTTQSGLLSPWWICVGPTLTECFSVNVHCEYGQKGGPIWSLQSSVNSQSPLSCQAYLSGRLALSIAVLFAFLALCFGLEGICTPVGSRGIVCMVFLLIAQVSSLLTMMFMFQTTDIDWTVLFSGACLVIIANILIIGTIILYVGCYYSASSPLRVQLPGPHLGPQIPSYKLHRDGLPFIVCFLLVLTLIIIIFALFQYWGYAYGDLRLKTSLWKACIDSTCEQLDTSCMSKYDSSSIIHHPSSTQSSTNVLLTVTNYCNQFNTVKYLLLITVGVLLITISLSFFNYSHCCFSRTLSFIITLPLVCIAVFLIVALVLWADVRGEWMTMVSSSSSSTSSSTSSTSTFREVIASSWYSGDTAVLIALVLNCLILAMQIRLTVVGTVKDYQALRGRGPEYRQSPSEAMAEIEMAELVT